MSEIRRDRLNNQYVLIAPERMHRPDTHSCKKSASKQEGVCPFCEGNEKLTPPEIYAMRENSADSTKWKTRVVPNLYKAVEVELQDRSRRDGMFESIPGVGAHEVLIDTPCHECDLHDMGAKGVQDWLRSIIIRLNDLKNDRRLVHFSIFKNVGATSGATQQHPHTQILALPVMPQNELVFLERNMNYYRRHGRGKLEDILENELTCKDRVVEQIGDFVAFCPYASSYAFELMIAPKRDISSLQNCSREDISDLSELLCNSLKRLKIQLGEFDYNLFFRLPPLNENFENEIYMPYIEKNYRFSIRVTPRIYRLGGFELSTGMAINPLPPEESASLLKSQ